MFTRRSEHREFIYLIGMLMAAQDSVNAAAAALSALVADVTENVAKLQAVLAALPVAVDTSALDAAVAQSSASSGELDAIVSRFPTSA